MIVARVTTNLDGKHPSWHKDFQASFPAMPAVGQVFEWYDWRLRIVELRWEKNPSTKHSLFDEMQLVVEINK